MSLIHAAAIFGAGIAAGTINTVVGSGTLITFPILLAFGYAPIVANVSNTIGLVPAAVTGGLGYQRELRGQRSRVASFGATSLAGAIAGSILLLVLPASAFKAIVPAFIAIALVLVILQPWLGPRLGRRRGRAHSVGGLVGTGACGVYGGYFGAAQGILLLGILSFALDDELQRLNALKVVLAGIANLVAGIVFAIAANVDWLVALLIAMGSLLGGIIGARAGRGLSPWTLRAVIVVVGVSAIIRLL